MTVHTGLRSTVLSVTDWGTAEFFCMPCFRQKRNLKKFLPDLTSIYFLVRVQIMSDFVTENQQKKY